jgi:hypothetical protein
MYFFYFIFQLRLLLRQKLLLFGDLRECCYYLTVVYAEIIASFVSCIISKFRKRGTLVDASAQGIFRMDLIKPNLSSFMLIEHSRRLYSYLRASKSV